MYLQPKREPAKTTRETAARASGPLILPPVFLTARTATAAVPKPSAPRRLKLHIKVPCTDWIDMIASVW